MKSLSLNKTQRKVVCCQYPGCDKQNVEYKWWSFTKHHTNKHCTNKKNEQKYKIVGYLDEYGNKIQTSTITQFVTNNNNKKRKQVRFFIVILILFFLFLKLNINLCA